MKFSITSSQLYERLQVLSQVIVSKNAISMLDNFLFEFYDGKLKITATNTDLTAVTELQTADPQGEGTVAVSSKYLLDLFAVLGDVPVTFEVDESNYQIKLSTGAGHYSFIGISGAEFPRYKQMEEGAASATLDSSKISAGLDTLMFAVGQDEFRAILQGVYFDFANDGLVLASTNTQVLSRYTIHDMPHGEVQSSVVPTKTVALLRKIIAKKQEPFTMTVDSKYIMFDTGDYVLLSNKLQGVYPNYNSVIPQDSPYKIIVDRNDLLSALKRVSVCTNSATSLVKLNISNGSLRISGQDYDFSTSGEETIPCQYEGDNVEQGFKATNLVQIMQNLQAKEVVIGLTDPVKPGTFTPLEQSEGTESLVMLVPMMLS